MEGYTNEIQLVNVDGLTDFERIDSILRTLIVSIEGTIPGSRSFGLSGSTNDMRPEESRNIFLAELDEKVEIYLPEIQIEDVEFRDDIEDGNMVLRIFVEANDEREDEDDD